MDAVEARLGFTSLCVETWGYYDYPQKLEDAQDERLLMWWWGGNLARINLKGRIIMGQSSRVFRFFAGEIQ
ncbi:hypothetical protein PF008_g12698 [Phytophthora fragariae]|uniref:Uncharacterized protein n=1 Tax=Phytophthora fragariae TaxID=53985 RepID=A0A6G0RMM8_9STRA|nr:hypothetical protein PF008_g12698 [Phytophthora fragariae]